MMKYPEWQMLEVPNSPTSKVGFTLIELSIVLVIIGLIAGGVLVGKDLMVASAIRSQITQIESFRQATYTFKNKYNCLPGDCFNAEQFGFVTRHRTIGRGDGNGQLFAGANGWQTGWGQGAGEVMLYWRDLSEAGLIAESFSIALSANGIINSVTKTSTPSLYDYYPVAKVSSNNFVYVWSGGINSNTAHNGKNYFGVSMLTTIYNQYNVNGSRNTTVNAAYNIDTKIDDGLPHTGKVTAMFLNGQPTWSGASGTAATAASSATCYDNGNVNGAAQRYSTSQNNGSGANCGLAFEAGF